MAEPSGGSGGDSEGVRLQKLLARAGVGSRRASEEMIAAGRVEVDGAVVDRMGMRVDPATAVVRVDGRRLPPPSDHVHLVLNKPVGVVSTMDDPEGRQNLSEFVADRPERLFHVGRLDTDTSGLILLTNHGELAHRLAHPSFEVVKTYVARVEGDVSPATVRLLRDGVRLEDGFVPVDRVKIRDNQGGRTLLELDLHVGRNRVVRRLLDEVGHPVLDLSRTVFGPVRLGSLRSGRLRELTGDELGAVLDSVRL